MTTFENNDSIHTLRGCARHGVCTEQHCPKCGKQTYDLADARERREVAEVRALYKKASFSWPAAGFVLFGMAPDFVQGLMHGQVAVVVNFVPAAVGLGLGVLVSRLTVRTKQVREMERILGTA